MTNSSHIRFNRRDRRKAKESEFTREGKTNPRKVSHALTENYSSNGKTRLPGLRRKKRDKTNKRYLKDLSLTYRPFKVLVDGP